MDVVLIAGQNRNATGVDRYARELSRALQAAGHGVEWVPFTRREVALGPIRAGGLASLWAQRLVWRGPRGRDGRVVHALDPSIAPPGVDVVTVHDLIAETNPAGIQRTPAERFDWALARRNSRRARHLIAISEATRQDVIDRWGVPPDRVSVVHHGIDVDRFRPTPGGSPHLAPDRPNLVYVGDDNPRKNLTLAVATLAALHRRHGVRARLVRVGPTRHPGAPYRALAAREGVDLVEPGFVADEALPALYTGADAFLWPTLAEGFGFPPLEAMACGAPVVALDTPVNREVVGPLGAFHGQEAADAAGALHRVLEAPPAEADLRKHATAFTWARSAEGTAAAYARALATRSDG